MLKNHRVDITESSSAKYLILDHMGSSGQDCFFMLSQAYIFCFKIVFFHWRILNKMLIDIKVFSFSLEYTYLGKTVKNTLAVILFGPGGFLSSPSVPGYTPDERSF